MFFLQNDDMAVHYASRYGYIEIITSLIQKDASIANATNKVCDYGNVCKDLIVSYTYVIHKKGYQSL